MEPSLEKPLSQNAIAALGDIPPLPSNVYGAVIGRINRGRTINRAVFGMAASVLVAVSAFTVMHVTNTPASYSTEVAEELTGVNSYINSDVYKANGNSYSYYEEVLYQDQD
jgi:hypothetical protein